MRRSTPAKRLQYCVGGARHVYRMLSVPGRMDSVISHCYTGATPSSTGRTMAEANPELKVSRIRSDHDLRRDRPQKRQRLFRKPELGLYTASICRQKNQLTVTLQIHLWAQINQIFSAFIKCRSRIPCSGFRNVVDDCTISEALFCIFLRH